MAQHLHQNALLGNLRSQLAVVEQGGKPHVARTLHPSCSLILGAIDHFQTIIDLYGYLTGDRLCHTLLSAMGKAIRVSDHLISVESNVFLVVLKNTSLVGAATVAERLHTFVQKERLSCEHAEFCCTLSLGVATVHPHDSPDTLTNRLSQTFSLAVQAGGGQIKTEKDLASLQPSSEMVRCHPQKTTNPEENDTQ
jgi:diguanylate cyclase (GGDEF)-like protein